MPSIDTPHNADITDTDISDAEAAEFLRAEQVLLESCGVHAEAQVIRLKRLKGTARVLIAGDGPPVLFVPGVMNAGAVFAWLVGQLPDYRCIMVERPGTGLSPALATPPETLEAQREFCDSFLVDILDGLHIDRGHVVCTSMGGWATFRSLAAHPERFMRVAALSFQVGAPIDKVPWSMRMPLIKALLPRRLKAGRGMVRASLKTAGMKNTIKQGKFSDELLDYLAALVRCTPTFRNESLCSPRPVTSKGRNLEVEHSPELLAKVTAPVHFFWGTDDLFGGETSARTFASMVPHSTLQLVEGAGHAVWLDEPELALAAVRAHLAG